MRPRRRDCSPAIVGGDGTLMPLERIPLRETLIKEHFPQELIRRNPDLLPVAELEPTFAPLITVGWEVSAPPAGSIDVLCINPGGRLTIVETKLWRNPQALRDVVSQVIDYASQVSRWSYEDLEQRVVAYNQQFRSSPMGLFETVVHETGDHGLDEAHFVDRVTTHLRRGRMLLAVAGDGIQERLEDITSYLQVTPSLHFRLMLVEMQFYQLPGEEDRKLMIPQLVLRSKEVERAVVGVRPADASMVVVEPPQQLGDLASTPQRARLEVQDVLGGLEPEEREFVESLMADVEDLNVYGDPGGRDLMLRLPNPAGFGGDATLLKINPEKRVLSEDRLPRQLIEQWKIPQEEAVAAAREYYEAVIELYPVRKMPMNEEGHGEAWQPHIPISIAIEKDAEFRALFRRTVERLVALGEQPRSNTDSEE